MIEQSAALLKLEDSHEYNEQILVRAAKSSEEADRVPEAIKLYNLAGEHATVVGVLAHALGNTIALPSVDEKARDGLPARTQQPAQPGGQNGHATAANGAAPNGLEKIGEVHDDAAATTGSSSTKQLIDCFSNLPHPSCPTSASHLLVGTFCSGPRPPLSHRTRICYSVNFAPSALESKIAW